MAALACCRAAAQIAPPEGQAPPRVEMWSGAESLQRILSVYSGAGVAPFGGIREDGFRLRGVLGYGDYGNGAVTFGDFLIGYHKQLGPITLKMLGGITVEDHRPGQPLPALEGPSVGGKGILETWWTITDRAWASADLSWGSLHMDYGTRVRLGWRFWPELSAGVEGGSAGTSVRALEPDTARIGAFMRYEWSGGEVSISGGLTAEGTQDEREGPLEPFGTVSILTRF